MAPSTLAPQAFVTLQRQDIKKTPLLIQQRLSTHLTRVRTFFESPVSPLAPTVVACELCQQPSWHCSYRLDAAISISILEGTVVVHKQPQCPVGGGGGTLNPPDLSNLRGKAAAAI